MLDDHCYVLDAYHPQREQVREFVHSLSPYYFEKHLVLSRRFNDIVWIFYGSQFVSRHSKPTQRGDGRHELLKPRAWELAEALRLRVWVHHENSLFKPWKKKPNVWYPINRASIPKALAFIATQTGH